MDLELDDDQVALRDGIAALLAGRFPTERTRGGFDRAMFDELGAAGVFSLRADGFGWADAAIVFEQLGRSCVPGPLVGCLLAGEGVTGVVERARPTWIEHLAELESLYVLDGDQVARVDPRLIDAKAAAWPLDPITPVTRVDELPDGDAVAVDAAAWRRVGAALTAAFQLGLADRMTEVAVAYAHQRVQFDRPIASFQAIKHICADMLTRTEVARAAVYAAAAHLDAPDLDGLDRSVSTAKIVAGEAAIANGRAATQVHGGMGYTWEIDVHLFLKRAWALDTQFGSADVHADRIGAGLGPG
ncbi:MAG: acyl-CoA dehydrogenase family protein [Acidimicrobiia bacterium]